MKLIVRESQKFSTKNCRLAFSDVRHILFIPYCLLSD